MDYGDWRFGTPQLDPKVQATIQALRQPNAVAPVKVGPGEYWQQTWPGAESVDLQVVDNLGAQYPEGVQGWTTCDKDKRTCTILMLRNANRECVEAHERKHAAGYDHPNYPRGYICPK